MLRNLAFVVGYAVIQVLFTTASVWAADFGTAQEAKAIVLSENSIRPGFAS